MEVPYDFCCLSTDKNIFMKHFTEYEYHIYSFFANWPNMNIEYIRNQNLEYLYSNI